VFPSPLVDNNVAFNGTALSLILIDFTPMKYSAEGLPRLKAEAVLIELKRVVYMGERSIEC
jgi:hypothetical protein